MGKYIFIGMVTLLALGTFYGTSQSFKNSDNGSTHQKKLSTFLDAQGKLHVMGVVLNESSVRDAELAFRSRSQAAIFMYPEKNEQGEQRFHLTLESYFPSIADHSKVILSLNISAEALEGMRQRGSRPRIYPNDVIRVNIANVDILPVQKLSFHTLKIVPSIDLERSMLEAQFGTDYNVITDTDGTHYKYAAIGLDALFPKEGKVSLSFSTPTMP